MYRLRPVLQAERAIDLTTDGQNIDIDPPSTQGVAGHTRKAVKTSYVFDRVFTDGEEVGDPLRPLFEEASHGRPICIMAYGYSGSGKTHELPAS